MPLIHFSSQQLWDPQSSSTFLLTIDELGHQLCAAGGGGGSCQKRAVIEEGSPGGAAPGRSANAENPHPRGEPSASRASCPCAVEDLCAHARDSRRAMWWRSGERGAVGGSPRRGEMVGGSPHGAVVAGAGRVHARRDIGGAGEDVRGRAKGLVGGSYTHAWRRKNGEKVL